VTLTRAGFLNDPKLFSEVEAKMSESSADNNDPTLKIENIILSVWEYFCINEKTLQKLC